MRLGNETIGSKGLAVLLVAAVSSVGLALHGYGNGGTASSVALGTSGSSSTSTTATTQANSPKSSSSAKSTPGGGSTTTTTPKLGPVLSSTQYASYAYKLYPGTPSSKAKLATAGFNVKVTPSGSNIVVSVSLAGSTSSPQTSTIQKGDSVYFIEASFGDDSGNSDYSGGDDGLVITNPQGRVIE